MFAGWRPDHARAVSGTGLGPSTLPFVACQKQTKRAKPCLAMPRPADLAVLPGTGCPCAAKCHPRSKLLGRGGTPAQEAVCPRPHGSNNAVAPRDLRAVQTWRHPVIALSGPCDKLSAAAPIPHDYDISGSYSLMLLLGPKPPGSVIEPNPTLGLLVLDVAEVMRLGSLCLDNQKIGAQLSSSANKPSDSEMHSLISIITNISTCIC